MAKPGMGRGLAAILPDRAEAGEELRELSVDAITPNPDQPRTRFEEEALAALADSIAESGVIQPLLVHPLADGSYGLIAGERRWRAAQQAGLERVPAVIRDSDESQRMTVALIENMVREDLNPVEEARACAALVEDMGLSKEELGRRVGRSRAAISNLIRILDLPDEAVGLLETGELSEGHGRAILTAKGNDVRRRLARDAANAGWSVRETENRAKLAGQPGRVAGKAARAIRLSAEERDAMEDAADQLSASLGHEVVLRRRGPDLVAELRFTDLAEATALSRRVKPAS